MLRSELLYLGTVLVTRASLKQSVKTTSGTRDKGGVTGSATADSAENAQPLLAQ